MALQAALSEVTTSQVNISSILKVQAESSENPMAQLNNDDYHKPITKLSLLSDKLP